MDGTERALLRALLDGCQTPEQRAARENLWDFCRYIDPGFFREDRPHLKRLTDALQALGERRLTHPVTGRPCRRLMINLPPRLGKSYTLNLFMQWLLGRDETERIISVSYNEILAARFSRSVRDGIMAESLSGERPVFSDVFPATRVKEGDAAAQIWALRGQYFNYLGAGFGGTITGVGCSVGIIDDPVKNHMEALNPEVLDAQWRWYTDTFLSRIEEGGAQIVVMTRWAPRDLCGRLLAAQGEEWYHLCEPACLDERTQAMLCPSLLSWQRYRQLRALTGEAVALANYQQTPVDPKGLLYPRFSTYADPPAFERVISYTDTADTGADFLCCVAAGVCEGRLYLLDVCYTDLGMEHTEGMVADLLHRSRVEEAVIESNNGGRGFARSVERLLWERHRSRATRIVPQVQRQNKRARLLVQAPFVMDNLLFPQDWATRWPEFYRAMSAFQRAARNAHDDAPDAVTGLCEMMQGGRVSFASGRGGR